MKIRLIHLIILLCAGLVLSTLWFAARGADLASADGSVVCTYSHRLPDDPIIYPGRPGIAMQHDFFGHTTTTADTTTEDLYTERDSTCENAADNTAYWAPSLKLPDGTVVAPSYQKTYYQNRAYPSQASRQVTPFPPGLQMLAGDHHGSAPSPIINFLCTGRGYTTTIPINCVPDPTKGTQFNIALAFPNCWDGIHLSPFRGGANNVAYADADGVCPAAYPVPLPLISLNIAYMVGNITDMTGTMLSMDPTLDQDGNVVNLNWGSLYTAHADFFNGWTEGAMRYLVEYCLNKGRSCGRQVAYSFADTLGDATVRGGDTAHENYGQATSLLAQQAVGDVPESKFYIQFDIPKGALDIPVAFTPEYRLLIRGANTAPVAEIIRAYRTPIHWHEDNITSNNAPVCEGPSATLYLDQAENYRYFNVTQLVNDAIAAGEQTISFCIRGNPSGNGFRFDSSETDNKPILYLYAVNPITP